MQSSAITATPGAWITGYWREKSRIDRALDLVVGLFWAVYASLFLASLLRGGSLSNLGLVLFYTLVAILFVLRRPARQAGTWGQTAVAMASVFWPIVVLRATETGFRVGDVVQVLSFVAMLVAAFSLGPSFGIAPADRGLRTGGMYRWVRHPLYASEMLFYLGYLVSHPSWHNGLAVMVTFAFIALRIRWEERLLKGYANYARQVRWRLVPYVW